MSFYEFMVGYRRYGRINDLANDIRDDGEFPKDVCTKRQFITYLKDMGACTSAIETADKAWAAYLRKCRNDD